MSPNTKLIIYIGNFELPDKNAAAQRVIANGKIFRDLGYRVIFIGVTKDTLNHNIITTKKECFGFDSWSVPYPVTKSEWLKQIITPIGLKKVISQYPDNPLYAVISYNYPAIAQYKIKAICKSHNAFLIPDITEWPASTGRGLIKGVVKSIDTFLRMRLINLKADALITTSPYLTKFYKKSISNILELPTLYDSEKLNSDTYKKDKHTSIKFMYAGSPFNLNSKNIDGRKVKDRLDRIIKLFSQVETKNYILNIYGLTQDNYLKVYPDHEKILKEREKKILFHGRQPHKEIIKQIHLSDFTIFFRDIDRVTEAGFPSKLSESITAGTPVITNMISNLKPYIKKEKGIYIVDLKDKEKQTTQLNKLLSLSSHELNDIKQQTLQSKTFDYRSYISTAETFLRNLNR